MYTRTYINSLPPSLWPAIAQSILSRLSRVPLFRRLRAHTRGAMGGAKYIFTYTLYSRSPPLRRRRRPTTPGITLARGVATDRYRTAPGGGWTRGGPTRFPYVTTPRPVQYDV